MNPHLQLLSTVIILLFIQIPTYKCQNCSVVESNYYFDWVYNTDGTYDTDEVCIICDCSSDVENCDQYETETGIEYVKDYCGISVELVLMQCEVYYAYVIILFHNFHIFLIV